MMLVLRKFTKLACFLLLLSVASCKKDGGTPGGSGVVIQPNGSADPRLLLPKTWVYYEYFENYTKPTASLVYKLERAQNTLDLAKNKVTFKDDGTYQETKDVQVYRVGKWKAVSSAEIDVTDDNGALIFKIITVSDGFWVFSNTDKDIYGTMLAR